MANKFKKGDKVVKKGTTTPIMTVKGNTMRKDIPYSSNSTVYVCDWETNIRLEREEFQEDDLEPFVSTSKE